MSYCSQVGAEALGEDGSEEHAGAGDDREEGGQLDEQEGDDERELGWGLVDEEAEGNQGGLRFRTVSRSAEVALGPRAERNEVRVWSDGKLDH